MVQLNRREFLYGGVAASAATTLPHLWAMSSEDTRQPGNLLSHEANTAPSLQFERNYNFTNWREQGLNFSEKVRRNRQYPR